MSSIACTNCGAEITPGTKFCRRCGQPSLDTSSVSEATTRVFEAQVERAASPTQTWQSQPTGPAYIAPASASPLQDVNTKSLEPTGRKSRKSSSILFFVLLFAAMLVAFAVGMRVSRRATTTAPTVTPPVVTQPGTDLPPPPPPPPPGEPPASGPSVETSELMYPGAETVMNMKTGSNTLLQLRTNDQISKVVDWYTARLKATEVIKTRNEGAVLRTGSTNVIISSRGDGTDIIIKQGVGR